jgi:hypothetical protein
MKAWFSSGSAGIRRRLLVPLAGAAAIYACDGPIVTRTPVEVPEVPGYGNELRALDLNPAKPQDSHPQKPPGSYPRSSPDGTLVAVTTEARGHAQTINIWNPNTDQLRPLLSIEEFDPGSGRAFRYAWSRDGKALLIYGHGRLVDGDRSKKVPDERMRLCLVYEVERDVLSRIYPCKSVKWAFE